jgi:hypothetical protein
MRFAAKAKSISSVPCPKNRLFSLCSEVWAAAGKRLTSLQKELASLELRKSISTQVAETLARQMFQVEEVFGLSLKRLGRGFALCKIIINLVITKRLQVNVIV